MKTIRIGRQEAKQPDNQLLAQTVQCSNPSGVVSYSTWLRSESIWLRIKDGPHGAELWTIYQKSMGGRKGDKTKPRRLQPLLVRDLDGSSIDWNLQGRIQIGEELPPLQSNGLMKQGLMPHLEQQTIVVYVNTLCTNYVF